ncbi:hypothetical protein [Rudanella lutea]|uniref:hypothetical protein n=1 Tax=Rudanella lutea TaxID=451374 RepID=UPI0003691793|nr:hypothetical protein [Rudanella lutea]
MKTLPLRLRPSLALLFVSLFFVSLAACSRKEDDPIDPENPGAAVVGSYTIDYYNANGTEYDKAKVGAIGTISVVSSGREFVEVNQVLSLQNTTIFSPFPTSMRIVKNGNKSVLLQTYDSKPIGSITDGALDITIVDRLYTTTIRARRQ